jgi:hypothetical protein
MREVYSLIWLALVGAFRSRVSLEAENTILRHQLNVLRRQSPKRPTFGMLDRLIFAGLYRLAPKVLGALAIVKPETVIKWHRAGFRSYWRWKSRRRGGRPTVAPEIRKLIREMSIANPLWGAPRTPIKPSQSASWRRTFARAPCRAPSRSWAAKTGHRQPFHDGNTVVLLLWISSSGSRTPALSSPPASGSRVSRF